MALAAAPAHALVEGKTPAQFQTFQVFGDGVSIGNTLMANPPPAPYVNTVLLNSLDRQPEPDPDGREARRRSTCGGRGRWRRGSRGWGASIRMRS